MDSFLDSIIEFVRVRQLNFAVAGILTMVYLIYQYWGIVFKGNELGDDEDCHHATRRSRSRTRSRSGSRSRTRSSDHDYKLADSKHSRRSRKYKRCPECGL